MKANRNIKPRERRMIEWILEQPEIPVKCQCTQASEYEFLLKKTIKFINEKSLRDDVKYTLFKYATATKQEQ